MPAPAPEEPVEVSAPFITNESAKSLIGLATEEAPRKPAAPEPASAAEEPARAATDEGAASESAEPGQIQWPYAEIFARAAANEGEPQANEAATPAPEASPVHSEPVHAAGDGEAAGGSFEAPAPSAEPTGPQINAPRTEAPAREAPIQAAKGDGGRVAGHLSAAGEMEAAAAQFLEAALQASDVGAYPQALAYAQKSIALLAELPLSTPRRRLRARVLAELGRLHWQCAGPDVSFTLAGALDVLAQARSLLRPEDPPGLWAEVDRLIAGVCYDIGDMRSLERALDVLTHSSRLLLNAGDAQGAARLLNDQAAVYVRMGDPVRATHLLSESRKIFEERAATDPVAMLELAETDHLFARIPLHVAARPGRESDALLMGLDHAIAAERTYKKVGAKRELGRVWETMGRLELKRGKLDRAAARLSAAIQVQESIGDVLGLAKTTATLSEVFAADGRLRDALAVLGDSIALNLERAR